MKITQHVPAFVECDPHVSEFATTEELLGLEWVGRYGVSKNHVFDKWAIDGHHLMAIYDRGTHWTVVGVVSDPEQVALEKWGGPKS